MYKIYISLFVIIYYFQRSLGLDKDTIDLLTPDFNAGEACGYMGCLELTEGKNLYVHIVPYSHNELGYTATFDGHYTGRDNYIEPSTINVKRILDYTISELWAYEHRTFTYSDMAYFFHWWSNRDETVRRMVYTLIRSGRLYFVGGGWSMSDEATTSYHAIIDHFTYTLRKINATFLNCGRPLVAWQADVLGHSREFASLMAQMGFDGLFVNPISFDDELPRMRRKALEFVWRGSDDLGPASDIYTHKLFDGYWPPPGFCFGSQCKDPLLITSSKTFENAIERIDEFVRLLRERQAPYYTTKHVMVVMGMRDGYHDASVWFANIDKLIGGLNGKYKDIQMTYSTPACYLKGVYDSSPRLQTKQDDFFPFAYDRDSYAVGMYTSRPSVKYIAREGHRYLQIAKQVQVIAQLGNNDKVFEEYNWINGVFQDHNIISGEMRHYVMKYYVHRMHITTRRVIDQVLEKGFNKLRNNTDKMQTLIMCKFNISRCHSTTGDHFFIVIYNPLAWPVTMPVRLPMYSVEQLVYDHTGNRCQCESKKVKAGLLELPKPVQEIPGRQTAAHMELVFIAEDLPPMGVRSYYLQKHTTGWERPKRSSRVIKKKRNNIGNVPILFNTSSLPDYEYFEDYNTTTETVKTTTINTDESSEVDDVTRPTLDINTEDTNKFEVLKTTTINADQSSKFDDVTRPTLDINTEDTSKNEDSTIDTTLVYTSTVSEDTADKVTTQKDETVTVTTSTTEITTTEDETETTTLKYLETDRKTTFKVYETTSKNDKLETTTTTTDETTNKDDKLETTTTTIVEVKPTMKASGFLSDTGKDYRTVKPNEDDEEDLFEYWQGYPSYIMNEHSYIRNRFTRVNLDHKKKVVNIAIKNGVRISLNIEMYYYVSDDPKRLGKQTRPPGAYLFRTMDSKAEVLNEYEANVYKNQVVQEVHMKFGEWASVALRLYGHSPVLEVDWLVGPIPIDDGLGKEVLIKYTTNLTNNGVFYTDSNGRQTIKRIRNLRPAYDHVNKDPIAGNFYPVTSKIYIEDLQQNVRFAVLNDRAQGGSSLKDGEINMLLHRRLLTEDGIAEATLNETDFDKGTVIRGQHYIYVSKADHKPYRVFEKKLAKEIELKPQILTSPGWGFGIRGRPLWMSQGNEFSGLKSKLPLGVHILTLEQWNDGGLLLRFENYLEKADCTHSGLKKVYLKDLFSSMEILSIKEMTLSAHMLLKDWVPLSWRKDKFVKSFNEGYGSGKFDFVDKEESVWNEVDLNHPIVLTPQQIRTFVVQFRYLNHV